MLYLASISVFLLKGWDTKSVFLADAVVDCSLHGVTVTRDCPTYFIQQKDIYIFLLLLLFDVKHETPKSFLLFFWLK